MPNIWRFNRGDWSEAYVFLKALGDGRIYGANADFQRNPSTFLDIIAVHRFENKRPSDKVLHFRRALLGIESDISAFADDVEFAVITSSEMREKAEYLYNCIKNVTNARRKIEIPNIQQYLENIKFSSPKAPGLTNNQKDIYGSKTDIIITTEDSMDHAQSTDGFSIKSHMGSPSTLLNYSEGSNMVYRLVGCDEEWMHRLNAMDSQREMIAEIKNNPALSLEFINFKEVYDRRGNTLGHVFADNLEYIDTRMIEIVNVALLARCGYTDILPESHDIKDIVDVVSQINPLNVRRPEMFYKAKFKDLLFASFGGMTVSTPWDGRRRITGGYIDVSQDGDLLYYRALSDDVFNSYLYEHTYIDLPQRGRKYDIAHQRAIWHINDQEEDATVIREIVDTVDPKGNCAYIYQHDEDGEQSYYLNLNFQIRFR